MSVSRALHSRRMRLSPGLVVSLLLVLTLGCAGNGDGNSNTGGDGSGTSGGNGGSSSSSSSTPSSNPSGSPEACKILTPADVQAVIGSAPEPDDDPVGPFSSCAYYASVSSFVQFQVCRCFRGNQFVEQAEQAAEFFEVDLKPVSGIGDKAYWLEGILWVQKGDYAFNLWISKASYFQPDGTALRDAALEQVALPDARDLALKLLARLN